MDLEKYIDELPSDLNVIGKVPEYQLLKLFSFYAYYGGDTLETEDLEDSCFFSRQTIYNIDGVFINQSLEEDAIECVYSYYANNNIFSIRDVQSSINFIFETIDDSISRQLYLNEDNSAVVEIKEYMDQLVDNQEKRIIIRVITNYDPNEEERFNIFKQVESFERKLKNFIVTATISFGSDIESLIDANTAPYDCVQEGKLVIDSNSNFLKYSENSIICNISAKSLKDLWKKEGNKGLLAMNLRYFVKQSNIDEKIEYSIQNDSNDFWYLNNGIIIVCDEYNIINNELRMKNFSIINGGQTTRLIGETPFHDDFFITCKLIKNVFLDSVNKNEFVAKVAEASNTQKPIKSKDIIANRIEQRELKPLLQSIDIFIEIKRGEKPTPGLYPKPWQKTKNNQLAQDLYSFVFMQPGPSRNNVSQILNNKDKYNTIFAEHKYNKYFLKNLLYIEKAFREYQKKVASSKEEYDPTTKGLIKNGLYYCLATLGYLLKFIYNKEFIHCVYKYRNNEGLYDIYLSELAFNHLFISENKEYKDFKNEARSLFDYLFSNFIKPQYDTAKEINQSLAYSNWTKTNSGFKQILISINRKILDEKNIEILDYISKYFLKISEEQMNDNIDKYYDYCKAKLKTKGKVFNTVDEEINKKLSDELMKYRLIYSTKKHIKETLVFTDKQLEKIVKDKPVTKRDLYKYINANSVYYCSDDILEIIKKYSK